MCAISQEYRTWSDILKNEEIWKYVEFNSGKEWLQADITTIFRQKCKIAISQLFSGFQNIYSSFKLCNDIFMFNNCIPHSVIQDKNSLNTQQERFQMGIRKTFLVDQLRNVNKSSKIYII